MKSLKHAIKAWSDIRFFTNKFQNRSHGKSDQEQNNMPTNNPTWIISQYRTGFGLNLKTAPITVSDHEKFCLGLYKCSISFH